MTDVMDIRSPPGTRVQFARPDAGYIPDIERAAKHLVLGVTYTVERTDVHAFSTDVFLREIPGEPFNSVMFDRADDKSGEEVMLVRTGRGLEELREGDLPSSCCQQPTFFSVEHDNFYCSACKRGQGNEYHARNVAAASPRFAKTNAAEER